MRRLGDAEVDDLHRAVVADEDVRRRHVAMDDVERLLVVALALVRVVQTRRGRRHDRDDVARAACAASSSRPPRASWRRSSPWTYSIAKKYSPFVLADVVDLHDVLVVEARGEARLVEEHRDEALVSRVLGANPLEHDVTLEAFDAVGAPEQDVGHAARRQMLEHGVPPETLYTHRIDRMKSETIGSSSTDEHARGVDLPSLHVGELRYVAARRTRRRRRSG